MSKSTLSLVLIAKNEEQVIGRCLDSVVGIVDEIVVVDTGSTDSTKQIAASYEGKHGPDGGSPLKVIITDFEWCHDFSAARNAGLDVATGDWILQLDADETLASVKAEFEGLFDDESQLAYKVRIKGVSADFADGQVGETIAAYRLFRRDARIRYMYPLHERIDIPGELAKECPITILHYGGIQDEASIHRRAARNIPILQKAVTGEPQNGFFHCALATEYFQIADYSSAMDAYRQAMEYTSQTDTYVPSMMRNVAWCLFELGHLDNAMNLLKELQQRYPEYTDVFFLEGQIALLVGQHGYASQVFRQCMLMGEPGPEYPVTLGGTGSWLAQQGFDEAVRRSEAEAAKTK